MDATEPQPVTSVTCLASMSWPTRLICALPAGNPELVNPLTGAWHPEQGIPAVHMRTRHHNPVRRCAYSQGRTG